MARNEGAKVHWMTPDGDDSTQEEIVAAAIFATVDIKGDRSGTGSMGLHEYVVARRRYQSLQGDLVMLPEWTRDSQRIVQYTRGTFETLYERMDDCYVRRTQAGKIKLLEEVYGPKSSSKLLPRMLDAYEMYNEWLSKPEQMEFFKRNGYAPMSHNIWDQLCKVMDPAPGLQGIQADALMIPDNAEQRFLEAQRKADTEEARKVNREIADKQQASKRGDEEPCTIKACSEFIREHVDGLTKKDANILAAGMRDQKWETANLPDDVWAKVQGGNDMGIRNVLIDQLAEYLDATDPTGEEAQV